MQGRTSQDWFQWWPQVDLLRSFCLLAARDFGVDERGFFIRCLLVWCWLQFNHWSQSLNKKLNSPEISVLYSKPKIAIRAGHARKAQISLQIAVQPHSIARLQAQTQQHKMALWTMAAGLKSLQIAERKRINVQKQENSPLSLKFSSFWNYGRMTWASRVLLNTSCIEIIFIFEKSAVIFFEWKESTNLSGKCSNSLKFVFPLSELACQFRCSNEL